MLQERRRTQALVAEQRGFARDVVTAANARYSSGTAPQSDVLRAEVEVARLEALARALISEVRGAEAMLNATTVHANRITRTTSPAFLYCRPSAPRWSVGDAIAL